MRLRDQAFVALILPETLELHLNIVKCDEGASSVRTIEPSHRRKNYPHLETPGDSQGIKKGVPAYRA